jgi:hypothetical protein
MDCITSKQITLSSVTSENGEALPSVESMKILGVIFSNDMKWNLHVDAALSKARRLYGCIRTLVISGATPTQAWTAHSALSRSIALYAYPAWCNLPNSLFNKLINMENRVERLIGEPPTKVLKTAADDMCRNLVKSIEKHECHPLRCIFDWTVTRTSKRIATHTLTTCKSHFSKTNRYKNSLSRYCNS